MAIFVLNFHIVVVVIIVISIIVGGRKKGCSTGIGGDSVIVVGTSYTGFVVARSRR